MDERQRVVGTERRRARRQFVERRAQRVEVGPVVDRSAGAPGLLGRQVRQRPHDLAGVGERRPDLGQRRRQREVHQARHAVGGEHDVRRADVSVQHPRRCISTTPRASPTATSISSSTGSGLITPDRLVSPASVSTIDPACRGVSSNCATPVTPRSRSRMARSCRNQWSASGPSGSLRTRVRPRMNRRVTRVWSLAWTASVRSGRSRPGGTSPARIGHLRARRTRLVRRAGPAYRCKHSPSAVATNVAGVIRT